MDLTRRRMLGGLTSVFAVGVLGLAHHRPGHPKPTTTTTVDCPPTTSGATTTMQETIPPVVPSGSFQPVITMQGLLIGAAVG